MSGSWVLTMGEIKPGGGGRGGPLHVNTVGHGQDAGWGWGRPGGFPTESRPDLNSLKGPLGLPSGDRSGAGPLGRCERQSQ